MLNINFFEIGQRIKSKRKELGMTQPELAQKVSLSVGSISKYENGKVEDATTSKFIDFATALNVTPAYLMGWDDPEEMNLESLNKNSIRVRDGIIDGYDKLSNENKKIIDKQIKYLLFEQNQGQE